MSFLVLPPEVNSALMFAGAGSGPTLAAAAAWDGLAAELGQAANSFSSATAALADTAWQGPAATAMAAAAAPYASWLSTAATRALSAAAQAKAAAAVYEAARAATVDPLLVAANRHQLVSLVLSNLFGQNAPAIAATEAAYEQLWAADVAAMVSYHSGASAVAAQLAVGTGGARPAQPDGARTGLRPRCPGHPGIGYRQHRHRQHLQHRQHRRLQPRQRQYRQRKPRQRKHGPGQPGQRQYRFLQLWQRQHRQHQLR